MPTDIHSKSRGMHARQSSSDQWTPRSRTFRRSRVLVVLAIVLLALIYYNHRREPTTHSRNVSFNYDAIDWSRYAYSQFATNSAYLCNSILVFEALHRLGSRADRILFYPEQWDTQVAHSKDRDSQLLVIARDNYKVKLYPVQMQGVKKKFDEKNEEEETWDLSVNKFLAFDQTQYDRVLHFDSDVTVLQHMDDLFLLPDTPVAMPRAYWELPYTRKLTSLLILLKPSNHEYRALIEAAYASNGSIAKFDMELLNDRYGDSAMVLPHRPFSLLSGEFRANGHGRYLGNEQEEWDTAKILAETRLIHFSDWPLPKPWIMWPRNLLTEILPKCKFNPGTAQESGCQDREVWKGLYEDFRRRRKEICALLSVPAPEWPPRTKASKPKVETASSADSKPTVNIAASGTVGR